MKDMEKAAKFLKERDYLLITAGAGMGVDSGLPDFRGKEGFWRAYPVAKKLNLRFEEMANPLWFDKDPNLAWAFYGHRLNLYRKTSPHKGFYKLLELAKTKKDYFVFTSNVDGQFQKAGFEEEKIDEVHGSIHYFQCVLPCRDEIWKAPDTAIEIDFDTFRAKEPLPRCKYCSSVARPNILMFGDWKWIEKREEKQRSRFLDFIERAKDSLVILEFGAGKAVPTVRMMGEDISFAYGAPLIRVNPRDYEVSFGNVSIASGAEEAIFKICDIIKNI